jgi:hypothetical protein
MSTVRFAIRAYPRSIFFYPLLVYSMIAYFVQLRQEKMNIDEGSPISWLSVLWVMIFCLCLIVNCFDCSNWRSMILILLFIAVIQFIAYLVIIGVITTAMIYGFNLNFQSVFYLWVFGILLMLFALIFFDSQRNSIMFTGTRVIFKYKGKKIYRQTLAGIQISYEIFDVIKYGLLGAGTFKVKLPGVEWLELKNVPFLKGKVAILKTIISINH